MMAVVRFETFLGAFPPRASPRKNIITYRTVPYHKRALSTFTAHHATTQAIHIFDLVPRLIRGRFFLFHIRISYT
jgi:hypothetical protein